MRHSWAIILSLSAATLLAACGGAAPPTAEATAPIDPLDIGDPEHGQVIFETGDEKLSIPCGNCHSLDSSDEEHGPSLVGISEQAGTRVPDMSAVEYLRESILDPSAYVVEGFDDDMEKFYKLLLSEEDIDDLAAYLLTQ